MDLIDFLLKGILQLLGWVFMGILHLFLALCKGIISGIGSLANKPSSQGKDTDETNERKDFSVNEQKTVNNISQTSQVKVTEVNQGSKKIFGLFVYSLELW